MVALASLLGAQHLWEVVETSRQVRLLCPWARHLMGRPTLCERQVTRKWQLPSECGLTVQNIAIHRFLVNGG